MLKLFCIKPLYYESKMLKYLFKSNYFLFLFLNKYLLLLLNLIIRHLLFYSLYL